MNELDLAAALLDESETVVSYPIKTQGSGDHESPVILLTDLDANRIQQGNSSQAGLVTDGSGNVTGEKLEHKYKASAVLEARSATETESYTLASDLRDHFTIFDEYASELHQDVQNLTVGNVKQTDPVVKTPEPLYKHYFTLSIKYIRVVTRSVDSVIDGIEDDITLN